MKMILLILLIIFPNLFGYNLLTGFLQPGNYTMEYGDDLLKNENWNALNLSTGLTSTDITECIDELYNELSQVKGKPIINFSSTVDSTASCIITYKDLGETAIMDCQTTANCGYTDFEIWVNTKIRDDFSWYCEGGKNSSINLRSVLKHELGHALGLYENFDDPEVLMYHEHDVAGVVTTIDLTPKNDDINGFKNVYEKPKVRVTSPHTFQNDTVIVFKSVDTVDIEFEVRTPNMLEHNSITPPDLVPVGFFTEEDDFYTGYDANFDSLGNDTYSFKTNMDDFITENGTDLQKLHSFIERDGWQYIKYEAEHSPDSALVFEIKALPKIIEPLIEDNHLIPPPDGKGAITDTIKVVVAIPQIDGAYPAINIKIDDVHVNQLDIVFEDNLWVYYWDLEGESSEITGKRFKIEAELFDDPSCRDESGAFITEALLFEDFEEFSGVGWDIYYFEYPDIPNYYGWYLYPDQLVADNTTIASFTQNSLSSEYRLISPTIAILDSADIETTLDFQVYFERLDMPHNQSYLYFAVVDENMNFLTGFEELNPTRDEWTNFNYDLTEFKGETIRLIWNNYYDTAMETCDDTIFALDSILVYVTPPPDMDLPVIDYITGTHVNIKPNYECKPCI